jgi:hypothetical protein
VSKLADELTSFSSPAKSWALTIFLVLKFLMEAALGFTDFLDECERRWTGPLQIAVGAATSAVRSLNAA